MPQTVSQVRRRYRTADTHRRDSEQCRAPAVWRCREIEILEFEGRPPFSVLGQAHMILACSLALFPCARCFDQVCYPRLLQRSITNDACDIKFTIWRACSQSLASWKWFTAESLRIERKRPLVDENIDVYERIYELFRHLNLTRTHVASHQWPGDWQGLASDRSELLASLTLAGGLPPDSSSLVSLDAPLFVFCGDAGSPETEINQTLAACSEASSLFSPATPDSYGMISSPTAWTRSNLRSKHLSSAQIERRRPKCYMQGRRRNPRRTQIQGARIGATVGVVPLGFGEVPMGAVGGKTER